ncbi:hypothetical protein PQX77_002584 [Marasmius sp. AFHP31]|nr:hypothetical protein PQX77_002584 [Marasmius sp. AFHP31]
MLSVTNLVRKNTSFAHDILKREEGDATRMFPEIRQGIRSARFEVLATSAQLNLNSGITAEHPLHATVSRTLVLIDNVTKLMDTVEKAHVEVVGRAAENPNWWRKVRRAAKGFRVESIRDVFQRIRPFDATIQRPFSVNPAPIMSFLGSGSNSNDTMKSTSEAGSVMSVSENVSGMSASDVSNWRQVVSKEESS